MLKGKVATGLSVVELGKIAGQHIHVVRKCTM